MPITTRITRLEREMRTLKRALVPREPPKPKGRITVARVRREFLERMRRDGSVNYLDFLHETGYPHEVMWKVLGELEDNGAIEVV